MGPGPRAGAPGPGPRAPKFGPAVASWFSMETAGSAWLRLAQPGSAGMGCAFHFRQGLGSSQLAMLGAIWFSLAQLGSASPCGHRGAGRRGPQPRRRGPARPSTNQIRPGRARRHRQGFGSHAQAWPLSGAAWLSLAQLGSAPLRGSGGGRAPARRISGGLAQLGSAWLSLAQLAWGARAAVRPHAPARWPDMISACFSLDGRPSSRAG